MIVIHKDDVALAREGIEILNEDQLKEVSEQVLVLVLDQFQGRVCMWGGGLLRDGLTKFLKCHEILSSIIFYCIGKVT